jgi:hypothetical protein
MCSVGGGGGAERFLHGWTGSTRSSRQQRSATPAGPWIMLPLDRYASCPGLRPSLPTIFVPLKSVGHATS